MQPTMSNPPDISPKKRLPVNWRKCLGEDFISFLGYNPLLPSIEVNLYAAYANPDSI
jgi:cell division transport system permease protein